MVEDKADSDEDWYDPQPQEQLQSTVIEANTGIGAGNSSNGSIRFIAGAKLPE